MSDNDSIAEAHGAYDQKFNREIQLKILTLLFNAYPESIHFLSYYSEELEERGSFVSTHNPKTDEKIASSLNEYNLDSITINLHYLLEHEVIWPNDRNPMNPIRCLDFKITSKGIDFLLGDGGLSAIFNVVTIKFADNEMERLMEVIRNSSVDEEKKSFLLDTLKKIPSVSLTQCLTKLSVQALSELPGAVQQLYTYLHHLNH